MLEREITYSEAVEEVASLKGLVGFRREVNTGELYIGGTQLMAGYWGAPDLTASVLRDDVVPGQTVYRTGDLVYRDRWDRYVYVDRADRVI